MMESNNGPKLLGRRYALRLLGVGLAAAGGVLALDACKGSSSTSQGGGGAQDCDATIDEQSRASRRTLQYNDVAVVPEKRCGSCAQYEAAKYGSCGGGCKLFPGPVKENGGCLSFAPKTPPAASSGKPG